MSEPMYKENDMVKLSLFPEGGWNKKNAGKTGAVQVTCTKPDVLFYEPYSPVFGSSRVTEDWGDQEYLIPARSEADIYKDGKYYKLDYVGDMKMSEPMYKKNDRVKLSLYLNGTWGDICAGKTGKITIEGKTPWVLFDAGHHGWGPEEYLIPIYSEADIYKDGKYYKLVEVQNPNMANYDIGYQDGFTTGIASPVNSKLWGKDDYESGFMEGVLDRHKRNRKETILEKFLKFFKKK